MGLFDRVLGKEKSDGRLALTKNEAFASVAVAAIASDGAISEDEVTRTAMNMAAMPLFRDYELKELSGVLTKVAATIRRKGVEEVLPAARQALSKEQLETAFYLASDLVLADGAVEREERQFLEELRGVLGVEEPVALKIVEVVVIKNRA